MKIVELTLSGFKHLAKSKFDLPETVRDFLLSNGFRLSGSGDFSQVYTKLGKNIAVKISTGNDKCWLEYANLVKNHPNKHFMKISRINKLGSFYIAFIEKLNLIDFDNSVIHVWMLYKGYENYRELSPDEINKIKQIEKAHPDFFRALELIASRQSSDCTLDSAKGNFMARDDGTLVIVDPLYYMEPWRLEI